MRTTILATLLLVPMVGGCAGLLIGAGAGIIASQELLDNNSYITHVNQDARAIWPEVKLFLSEASLELIETDDDLRVGKATIDGAAVTVSVEAFDLDRSIVQVSARKLGVNDGELARIITERLNRRIIALES